MAVIVKTQQLTEILDLSKQRIGQLVDEGMPKFSRGRYDAAACVQWYASRLKRRAAGDDSDLAQERLKLYRSQRIRTDLENSRTRKQLIEAPAVRQALVELQAIFASELVALDYETLALELASMKEAGQVLARLTDEGRAIREAVADKIESLARNAA